MVGYKKGMFEGRARKSFGEDGCEKYAGLVAAVEKTPGVNNPGVFAPSMKEMK
jgi:hypothetical protein